MNGEEYGTAVTAILKRGSEAKKKIESLTPDKSVATVHADILNQLDEKIRSAVNSITLDFLLEEDEEDNAEAGN